MDWVHFAGPFLRQPICTTISFPVFPYHFANPGGPNPPLDSSSVEEVKTEQIHDKLVSYLEAILRSMVSKLGKL